MGLPTAAPVERPSRAAAEYKKEKLEQKKRKTEQGLGALSGRVYNRDPEAGYQPDIRRNKESDTSETDIEEKKEKITEKLEFGKRTAKSDEISSTIELLTDEKAQNKRNNVRSSSENTYSQLSSKEKEFEQRVVKAKDELENINKKLEDLKREIAQYYEITADIDIDENNNLIGVGDIDSNLAPRDRSKATKARGELIKAIHKVKEAEEKFENAKDEKFSGGEILQKEVQNMLGSMENLGPQERKKVVRDFVERIAIKKLQLEGNIDVDAFYKKYFEVEDPRTGDKVSSIEGFFDETDVKNIIQEVTENTTEAANKRVMREMVDRIDKGEDPLLFVDTLLSSENRLSNQDERKFMDIAKQYSLNEHRRQLGDLDAVLSDRGLQPTFQVEYAETYLREFNPKTADKDLAALSKLRGRLRAGDRVLLDRYNKLLQNYYEAAARDMASGDSEMSLNEFFSLLDESEESLPANVKQSIESRYQSIRFNTLLGELQDQYIDGQFTYEELGILPNGSIDNKGILKDLIDSGEIRLTQAKEIAKMIKDPENAITKNEQYDTSNHNDRIQAAIDSTIDRLKDDEFMSDELKQAEQDRLEGMKFISEIEADRITGFFLKVEQYKNKVYKQLMKLSNLLTKAGMFMAVGGVVAGPVWAGGSLLFTGSGMSFGAMASISAATSIGGLGLAWTMNKARRNMSSRYERTADAISKRYKLKQDLQKTSMAYDIIHNRDFTEQQAKIALRKNNLDTGQVDNLNNAFDMLDSLQSQIRATDNAIRNAR